MSDRSDANDAGSVREMALTDGAVDQVRRAAAGMPSGEPGTCAECGRELPRIVGGYCGRCRDELGLP